MTNVESMAVVDAGDDLLKVVEGFVGVKTAFLDKVVEELAALNVFHDEVSGGRAWMSIERNGGKVGGLTTRCPSPRRPVTVGRSDDRSAS
jgi:hypothetical protein